METSMTRFLSLSFATAVLALSASARDFLIYNADDSHFFWRGVDKMTEAGLQEYLDEVTGGGAVTHFFMCPNAMRANFDSKAFEPIWKCLEEPDRKPGWWAEKAKLLHDRGVDPYEVWIRGCRARKVSPWVSMRMNDIHFVNDMSFCSHSTFWRTHPEFWRKPNVGGKEWEWADRALDYSHKEVRDYSLAFVKELLERYDMDGLECDWMRFPDHLPPGRERAFSCCLDAFMREVRKLANDASRRWGHPVRVGVRVDSDPDSALERGTDVFAWAKDGSVDLVVPCNFFHAADFELPYAEWKKRLDAVNPKVRVIPGTDMNVKVRGKKPRPMTCDEYRGWAARLYDQGAKGLYVFNLFCHPPKDGVQKMVQEGGLSRASIAKNRGIVPANAVRECAVPSSGGWRPKERWRGVNIIGMFNRRGEASASGFPDSSCGFKEEHFQWVKELGFNFVRLPLDYRNWCPDGDPTVIDEEGLQELDRGIAFGRKYGLHVQICLHHAPGYCILGWKNEPMTLHSDPAKLAAFCRQWAMLAKRYRDISNDELTFNLLNEPGGITDAEYERIFNAAIAAIRTEDPKRFVMLDGTNIGLNPVPAFFGKPLVGQAMRGYAPGGISHYGVHWALRPQTEPTWPLTVESPTMPWIYGPEHEKSRTLVVDNAPAGEWTWDFSPADEAVTLEVLADDVPVARHDYPAKRHELFTMRLAEAAKRVEIRPKGRGASRFGLLTIRSADGKGVVRLGGWCQDANIANRADGDNLHQRFMGWKEEFPFRLAENVGKPIERRGGTTGMDALEKFNFAPWKQASDKGVFCFVGEFGCFNKTPHSIALAWLEDQLRYFKQQNWGWSLWLMNGSFGFIDSGRDDVEYEDFHGHKLDRKMLDLLQKY